MSSCEGNPCKNLTQPFTCCKYAGVIFRHAGTSTSPLVNSISALESQALGFEQLVGILMNCKQYLSTHSSQAFAKEAPISCKFFGVHFCFSLQLKSMNLIQEMFSRIHPPSSIFACPPRCKALWGIGK